MKAFILYVSYTGFAAYSLLNSALASVGALIMKLSFLSVLFKQAHKRAKLIRPYFMSYAQAFRVALKASRDVLKNMKAQANVLRHTLERLASVKLYGEIESVDVWKRAVALHREILAEARHSLTIA